MSAAGVIAKGLTLILVGVGVGAAHSVVAQPRVVIRMEATEATRIVLPGTPDAEAGADARVVGEPRPGVASEAGPDAGSLVLEQYVTLDQAKLLWEHGLAEFIDARSQAEHAEGHIPRSHAIDPKDLYGGRVPRAIDFLDPEGIVVIYCEGGTCDASENVGRFLQQYYGFTRVHIMRDGFPVWRAAGLPVATGDGG